MSSDSTRTRAARQLLACATLATLAFPAAAVDWSGLGADFFWTTPANWVGGVAPVSDPSTVVTLPLGAPVTLNLVDAPFSINRLDMFAGYNTLGGTITFVGVLPQLNFIGASAPVQAPIFVTSSLAITNDSDQVLQPGLTGPGDIVKAGPGRLIVAATLHDGTTRIDAGILQVGYSGSSPPSLPGPVVVNGEVDFRPNGTMDISAGVSGPGAVTFFGGTTTSSTPLAHTGLTTLSAIVDARFVGGGPIVVDGGWLTTADSVFASLTGNSALMTINGTTTTVGSDGTSTTYTGSLDGPGGLTKVGSGRLTLAVNGFYNGSTTIDGGALRIGDGTTAPATVSGAVVNNSVLEVQSTTFPTSGTTFPQGVSGAGSIDVLSGLMQTGGGASYTHSGATTVRSGATLFNDLLGGGPLVVEAGGSYEAPHATLASLSGGGSLNTGFVTVGSDNASTTFNGPILGIDWTKVGTGRLTLSGATVPSSNIFVNAGTLRLGDGTTAPATVSANLVVQGALEFGGPGTTDLTGTVSGAGPVTVLSGFVTKVGFDPFMHTGGTFVMGGRLAGRFANFAPLTIAPGARVDAVDGSSFSSISGDGIVDTAGVGVALFGGGAFTFSGVFTGTGSLNLAGAQTLTLSGASTSTGGANVSQGTLVLTGSLAGPVQVFGGTLTGGGSIAGAVTVDAGATISPGVGVGAMSTGSLAIAGNAPFDILGPVAGAQHDQLNVTGTVTLTGATLSLAGAYVPAAGNTFVLIANDGTDPVSGTFAGLPEGAAIVFNGVTLRISYAGGTGNDVVLSAIPLAFDWSGLGGNASWGTNGNWVGAFSPPSAFTSAVSFGPAGTTFAPLADAPWQVNRIDISGTTPYQLHGAAITFGGASPQLTTSGAAHDIANPIVLAATLALANASNLTMSGAVSGVGGLVKSGAGTLVVTGSVAGPVTVNGGRLGGTGSISGAVTVNGGGTLAPGLSPGIINTGNLLLGGALAVEIEGTAAGTQYDITNVTGTVTIAGGTLQLSGAYVPVAGDVFTIVANDAGDPVTGTFAGLAQGATVTFNGVPLRISYTGGTGNDVVLSAMPLAFDWSGLGGDANWSTSGNWVGAFSPPNAFTSAVSFGAAGTTFAPLVDAPWQVNRIDISGAISYLVGGAAITFGGASPRLNTSGGAHKVANPVVLAATLTLANASNLTMSGAISGVGGLVKSGAGTLLVMGSVAGPVTVNGGTLGGTGSISGAVTVSAGGTLAPGLSPGTISTGNLVLSGALAVEIEGTAAGTQYDVTNVTGTVTIAGGTLQLAGAYVPVAGDVFTIVANDAVDAITGTFAGLAEGATVTFNGMPLRISYTGGTGNDVTLTAQAAAVAGAFPVPTLSEWAMVLLAVLLAACAATSIRRRRMMAPAAHASVRGLRP